jgi:hypothetical protein
MAKRVDGWLIKDGRVFATEDEAKKAETNHERQRQLTALISEFYRLAYDSPSDVATQLIRHREKVLAILHPEYLESK